MKKGGLVFASLFLATIFLFGVLSTGLVSANWFSDFLGKLMGQPITGHAVDGTVINPAVANNGFNCINVKYVDSVAGTTEYWNGTHDDTGVYKKINNQYQVKWPETFLCYDELFYSCNRASSMTNYFQNLMQKTTGFSIGSWSCTSSGWAKSVTFTRPSCQYTDSGILYLGQNNTPKLSYNVSGTVYNDPRFLCLNDAFYACGWNEVNYESPYAKKVVEGTVVGSWKCAPGAGNWVANTQTSATCTDSDGGLNYEVYGRLLLTYSNGTSFYAPEGEDYCLSFTNPSDDGGWQGLSSCSGSNCYVGEHNCSNYKSAVEKHACPNGCMNGACLVAPPVTPNETLICTDSDGGINYYVSGSSTGLTHPNNAVQTFTDSCANSSLLNEAFCSSSFAGYVQYTCPNGCVNSACVNTALTPKYILNKNFSSIQMNFNSLEQGLSADTIDYSSTLFKQPLDGEFMRCYYSGNLNNDCMISITLFNNSISSDEFNDNYLSKLSVDTSKISIEYLDSFKIYKISERSSSPNGYLINSVNYVWVSNGFFILINFEDDLSSLNEDDLALMINSYLAKYPSTLRSTSQSCESLINSVKNPVSTSERILYDNANYTGSDWINGQQEAYTEYDARWNWNTLEEQENQVNYYFTGYDIRFYDNKDVDLSDYAKWNNEDPACKINSFRVDDKENYFYICNWDVLNNQQDINNPNYNHNDRQIFWYNQNVVVRIHLYWGDQLTDAQVQKLSEQRMSDLINNLQNNQYKYIDWSNFELAWPVGDELKNSITSCGSDVPAADYRSWYCKTEPIICPPHGYQNKICTRWNPKISANDVQQQQISCSPGICSGCMIPKWFGETGGESKCIPYGFRFAQQTNDFNIIEINHTYTSGGSDEEIGSLSVADTENGGIYYEGISLKVYPNNQIALTVEGWDNITRLLAVGDSLDLLKILNMPLYDEQGNIITYTFTVNQIYYDTVNYSNSYFNYTAVFESPVINQTRTERNYVPVTFNMYCEIDGEVKQQKAMNSEGGWATCQNNYECRSNLCSEGECIEAVSLFKQIRGFFVKMYCKIINPISGDEYSQCVANNGI